MLKTGCHLSAAKGYENMAKEAKAIGANTFAFFTRNPRGGKSKALDEEDISSFYKLWNSGGDEIGGNDDEKYETMIKGRLVAHAPYTLNPCSNKEYVREFALTSMREDLERLEYTPGNYYNFHPGSHVGQGTEKGVEMIAKVLNEVMWEGQQTIILLETMSGKGSEIGGSFEELAEIIDRVELNGKDGKTNRIGVCMDTCHVSDAGYDIKNDLDGVLEEFDRIIGIDRLKAMHLNDSKNPCGSHKDRHEKIGDGYLGLDTFAAVVNDPVLKELPMILETPNDLEGYAAEIRLLRSLEK